MPTHRAYAFTMLLAMLLGCGALLIPSRVAYAATISVTTTADELDTNSACSLREAIRAANTNAKVGACVAGSSTGTDTIMVPAGTYVLTRLGADEEVGLTGDLDITSPIKIVGAGVSATVIDGNRTDRVLNVKSGATLTLTKVTVRNGHVNPDLTVAVNGGGIYNNGTLTLTNVTVMGNYADAHGAGIYNNGKLTVTGSTIGENYAEGAGGGMFNAASRSATITNSTIKDNDAYEGSGGIENYGTVKLTSSSLLNNFAKGGGGIATFNTGTAHIVASTISGNSAEGDGGGVVVYAGGTTTLINSTVSGNSGGARYPTDVGWGGGVDNTGGTIALYSSTVTLNQGGTGGIVGPATLANTIVAGNMTYARIASDCTGTLTSRGYNLISDTGGCTIAGDSTGNLLNVAVGLEPLQNNGGPTLTHALASGSPAIDAGNPAAPSATLPACPTKDQRNVTRPRDGNGDGVARCDMGAVER